MGGDLINEVLFMYVLFLYVDVGVGVCDVESAFLKAFFSVFFSDFRCVCVCCVSDCFVFLSGMFLKLLFIFVDDVMGLLYVVYVDDEFSTCRLRVVGVSLIVFFMLFMVLVFVCVCCYLLVFVLFVFIVYGVFVCLMCVIVFVCVWL